MTRQIILYFILYLILVPTLRSQNNALWKGYITHSDGTESEEAICDFVKDNQLSIAPQLSTKKDYRSHFLYKDSICLSRNFSFEVRFRNSYSINELTRYETKIGFFSNGKKTDITFVGLDSEQSSTQIQIADSVIKRNIPELVTGLNFWHTARFQFIEDTFRLLLDGNEIFQTVYAHNVCNIDILQLSTTGAGAIDFIYFLNQRNTPFWKESFESCEDLTPGIICDPFRIDQSITVNAPCESNRLFLTATFPAMSYRWTSPVAEVDTNQIASFPFAIQGTYDLFANINRCFVFSKNFDLTVQPQTIVKQDVKLCAGKTFISPTGKEITQSGIYRDTLQTIFDCDSIIIIKLTFSPIPISFKSESICSGQPYTLPSGKTVTNPGVYRDTIRHTEGCLQAVEITLSEKIRSVHNISVSICEGQTYQLPRGNKVSTGGVYRDTIQIANSCDSIIVTNLTINSKPNIKIEVGRTGEVFEGEQVPLSINTAGSSNYIWYEGNEKMTESQPSISVFAKGGKTTYKVIVKTSICEVSDSVIITALPAIELPNAFTPNSDNLNDNFTIVSKTSNENLYKIDMFQVFDRFGKQVYANENGLLGWDGTNNGIDLASDIYMYVIKISSPGGKVFQFSGDVALIR